MRLCLGFTREKDIRLCIVYELTNGVYDNAWLDLRVDMQSYEQ